MGGGTKDTAIKFADCNDLSNIHLRHAMLSSIHTHLKNYMLCMDRDYFGPRTEEEIELTKKLHETMVYTEAVLVKYFNTESEILG